MKINQKHFYEFNFQDFVHVKYLKHVLKDVARIIADNIPEHKTIDDLQFKTDKYGEQELHVTYTDFDNQSHDVLMKPAITDRVNELIDKRFRWIESGDEPIKKLEIKNHYFRITTDNTTADFEVPYIFNAGLEQDQLHFDRDGEEYIKIKLVARNTHDEVILEVPTKKNFDDLKADYENFKEAFYTWQTEVNNHLAEIDKKNTEQDGRLTDVEQKNTEQDNRLTEVEQKNTEQDNRLTEVEQKNTEQDGRLTNVEQKNTEQDNEISGIKDHQTSVDSIIEILQQKSHDFLKQLENPADFNDIKEDGNYFVYAIDTPDNHLTGENRPSVHWGVLYNYNHEPSNQVQIYAADTDNVLYMRTLDSSGWTSWQAVTTSTALQAAISELTKTLFNFYYDGLATETSVDGKPVAAKAMIINDDQNLFKGVAIFNQSGELLKRIILDDYATKEEVENVVNLPQNKIITLPYTGTDNITNAVVNLQQSTLTYNENLIKNIALPRYARFDGRFVTFNALYNTSTGKQSIAAFNIDQQGSLTIDTYSHFVSAIPSTVTAANSLVTFEIENQAETFDIGLDHHALTVGKTNINIPQISTPDGITETLLINNSVKSVNQDKVIEALNNLGLENADILNIDENEDQSQVYNNSNLIIKLDEINNKLNGNKRIYYISANNGPLEKQAIMQLPNIMNNGDIVFIDFFTVLGNLDPSTNDSLHQAIQGEAKAILFVKDSNGIISNKNWYWLETSKPNDVNYLTLKSSNIVLNVTKDNYNFSEYSGLDSQVTLP